jgi:hypothetical protein
MEVRKRRINDVPNPACERPLFLEAASNFEAAAHAA